MVDGVHLHRRIWMMNRRLRVSMVSQDTFVGLLEHQVLLCPDILLEEVDPPQILYPLYFVFSLPHLCCDCFFFLICVNLQNIVRICPELYLE